ncbi:SpaH/EbpB family LPXTG-anchored major pilin [Agrococcus sp. 1P02AA]|uniref:SpaH/EbpB family LPXTG-anchored major pilin n=1 Tax=Agrococcus sp. 1P02AA TaxID=3132259 RepID=UPI0039A71393
MAHSKQARSARVASGAGALALAAIIALGGALPASAAPNIDPAALGSITIHKFEEPATASGLANDGTEVDTSGLTPLAGVEFTVQQVTDIDLTTDEGWALAAETDAAEAAAMNLGPAASVATDGAGTAAFADLPVGVYLVTETDPGANDIAIASQPFLVSIPLPLDGDWLYDVHVYPKNSVTAIEKSVDESAALGLGSAVSWTVTAEVPEIAADASLTSFIIGDTLDSRLAYVGATVTATGVTLDAADYVVTEDGQQITVTFTAAGLAKLAAADGATVSVVIDTTVETLGDGIITNEAQLWVNDPTMSEDTGFTSTPVTTEWGTISILKHQAGDETAVLAGAEFQVFASEADALARTNPVAVAGETTFVTGADGIAFVPGLVVGEYWIVETRAPAGYQIDQTPVAVTVVAGDVTQASVDVSIANTQVPAYTLPLTGGEGQTAFVVGGAGLLLLAVGFALVRRRKAAAQA